MIGSRKKLEQRVTDIVFGATGEICNHDNDKRYTLTQAGKFMPLLQTVFKDDLNTDVFALDNLSRFQRIGSIVSHLWYGRK